MHKWCSLKGFYFDLTTVHILIVLSSEADKICFPSGVKATERAAPVWPFQNVLSPVMLGIQIATVPSKQEEAIKFPDGENETSLTPALWPENLKNKNQLICTFVEHFAHLQWILYLYPFIFCCKPQRIRLLSLPQETNCFMFGLNDKALMVPA